jgi:hypothetical protein
MMTTEQLQKMLQAVWNREMSADEAWDLIDQDRERPDDYSKEYWLPLSEEANPPDEQK